MASSSTGSWRATTPPRLYTDGVSVCQPTSPGTLQNETGRGATCTETNCLLTMKNFRPFAHREGMAL